MAHALAQELESTEMYLTLFYAVLDPAKKRLVFANAGHPHAFIVHGPGGCTRLDATDPPLGIAGPDSYSQREVAASAARGMPVFRKPCR